MEDSWLDESVDENLQFNLLSSDDVEAMLGDHLSSRIKAVISGGKKLFLDYNRSCPSASAAAAAPAAPAQLVRTQLQQLRHPQPDVQELNKALVCRSRSRHHHSRSCDDLVFVSIE